MSDYQIITDELKRLTNRCIGITLNELGDSINQPQTLIIKKAIRQFEHNIRKYILTEEQSSEQINR